LRSAVTRQTITLLALSSLALASATAASASTTAKIGLSFAPNVAGSPTTVTIKASFRDSSGGVPAPIRKSVTHLPPGLEIDVSGLSTCSLAKLELEEPGAGACPKASLLGAGTTFAEADLGLEPIQEHAPVTAVLGSSKPGRTLIYLDGEGSYPITEQVIAKATITGSSASGQTFTITVPPIPTSVGGPNASVLDFTMSLGRQKVISLDRHRRGKSVALPRGLVLPRSCHGKLAFPTKLFFAGGQSPISLSPSVPCPRR
jgi:hypothetical protein